MNIIQFNEIIELLHSISDNSTANIIALVSVIISGIAVLSSIYFSVQTRKQYIDSLSPLLSFRLYEKSGYYHCGDDAVYSGTGFPDRRNHCI